MTQEQRESLHALYRQNPAAAKRMSGMDEPVEEMDSDENAVRAILTGVFSQGRRHFHSPQEVAHYIERKRAKVNVLIDKYKLQAELGRATL